MDAIKQNQAVGPLAMVAAACFFVAASLDSKNLLWVAGVLWFMVGIVAMVRSRRDNPPAL